ncbi:uncharacterized protein DEA37_0001021 [Paragonimus westermani]|uniref:Uncharacterized protein n=1 Tax=Paragonimus westermani TaxID=34504 RepID=A0A5J4NVE7_9TREM|nr:uncharacterized protein DEA37_0001021 [Paragonimus westermani]
MFETEVNKTNSMHNTAHGEWLKKESNFEDKLETMTNDLESLKNALTCSQSQLTLVTEEKNQLLQTVDRLTAQLKSLTEEKREMNAILDVKLNNEIVIKAEYTNLLKKHQILQKLSQRNEQQLSRLNCELPAIVQTALIQAVNSVRAVAEDQLGSAYNRLEMAEKRLEVQTKLLRGLDLASSDLKNNEKTQQTEDVKRWFYCQLAGMLSLLNRSGFIQKPESKSVQSARTENETKRQSLTRLHIPAPPWRESRKASECTNSRRQTPKRSEVLSSPPIQEDTAIITWSQIDEIISKIHRQLTYGHPTDRVNVERLRTLETDNQVLRRKLVQLRSKFDRTRTCPGEGAINHRPIGQDTVACSTRCTSSRCHNSRSGLHSSSREQLEARCFRALNEASRWRQRFKQQAVTLRAEQERLAMMQVNQQSDYRLRDKFLHSVCQLITEASRQIDRVVQKHISRLACTAPVVDTEGHSHRPYGGWFRTENSSIGRSGEQAYDDESVCPPLNANLNEPDELQIRPKTHTRGHRLQNGASANGDGDGVHLTRYNQWSSDLHIVKLVPDAVRNPHHSRTQEDDAIHGHTNCNNNVEASQSPPMVIATHPNAHTHTVAKTLSASSSPQQTRSHVDDPPTKSGSQLSTWSDAVVVKSKSSDCSHSPIMSISTTLDLFDHEDSSICEALDQSKAISDQRIGEAGETEKSAITVLTKSDTSAMGASHSDPIIVRRSGVRDEGDLNRWLELRAAVRFELSRVITNVLRQAQRIADLQAELTEVSPHDVEKKTEPTSNLQPCPTGQNFQTSQWSTTTGEEGHCDSGLPQYLPTSNQLATRDCHSVNHDAPTSLSAIKIATTLTDLDRWKSPPVTTIRPRCIPTPLPTTTPTHTPEQPPSLDPVLKAASVGSIQSTTKRLTRTRYAVQRAKWKPVGGVIRPLAPRDQPPLLTRPRGITRRQPVHSSRPSVLGDKLSGGCVCTPGSLPSLTTRLHNTGNTSPRKSIDDPAGSSQTPKSNDPELAVGGGATAVDLPSDQPDHARPLPPLTSSVQSACVGAGLDALLPGKQRSLSNSDHVGRKLRGSVQIPRLEPDKSAVPVKPNTDQVVKQPFRKRGPFVKRMRGELTHADHSARHLNVIGVNEATKPSAPDTKGLPFNPNSGQVIQLNVNHYTKSSLPLPLRRLFSRVRVGELILKADGLAVYAVRIDVHVVKQPFVISPDASQTILVLDLHDSVEAVIDVENDKVVTKYEVVSLVKKRKPQLGQIEANALKAISPCVTDC